MLIKAAIRLNGKNYTGKRHSIIAIRMIKKYKIDDFTNVKYGFIDDKGIYLNRYAAYEEAIKTGQLKEEYKKGSALMSEDLW